MLQRRVSDAVKAAEGTGKPQYMGFLSDREQALAEAQLRRLGHTAYAFEGGSPGAERKMLCVADDAGAVRAFPFACVFIAAGGQAAALTHRDYLGALLALGIKRACVGDILPGADGAFLYLQGNMLAFVQDNLRQVGRCSVQVSLSEAGEAPLPALGEVCTATVASLRLDSVLAAMLSLSRSAAAALVAAGRVQVNHLSVETPSHIVYEGDVFSVRGQGKYRLAHLGGVSRKSRQFIEYTKY